MHTLKYTCCLILTLSASTLSAQQPDLLTDFEISGRVYEPQPIPPTDERIQRLSLPSGFVVHRFAEGLESPRMIATTAESRSR